MKPSQTASIVWRLQSATGVNLSGELQADLADKMTEIIQRAAQIDELIPEVRISYDHNQVIASVFLLPTEPMRARASDRAATVAKTGLSGVVSSLMLFIFRLGQSGSEELLRRLTLDYLQDELTEAQNALERRLRSIINSSAPMSRGSISVIDRY